MAEPGYKDIRMEEVEVAYKPPVPASMINAELEGLYGSSVVAEMSQIIKLYDVYENGAKFSGDVSKKDYIPANLKSKQIRNLINKQARFMFSKNPDIKVNPQTVIESDVAAVDVYQNLIDSVLKANGFTNALLKAGKDCFIGKRVALFVNFNQNGIGVNFLPSLEFIYDVDYKDTNKLNKIVAFYILKDDKNKAAREIYRKRMWMKDGYCWVHEAIFDGHGKMVSEELPETKTEFEYIPAFVILNGGLTGDMKGESEVVDLLEDESWYNRLSNSDIDSERMGMNPIRWTMDVSKQATENLSVGPGAYWDLQTDYAAPSDSVKGQVGMMEPNMNYSTALASTLNRIKKAMNDRLEIPDIADIQSKISSGKELKAIYWGLIVRCDEKWIAWKPALEFMARTIVLGSILYPEAAKRHISDKIPDNIEFEVHVENQYPLPEDEAEEKAVDITEVNAQTMSKLAYMKKWRGLTDEEANEEIKQMALERQMLEESYTMMPLGDTQADAQ